MNRNNLDNVNLSIFGVPSWRIQQKYSPGVLIGNWAEDNLTFPETKYKHNSTYRIDYLNTAGAHPDVTCRRNGKLTDEGLPANLLFGHHGNAYDNMHVTLYDEHFNGRWHEKNLPPLRSFDGQTLRWLPERSDHPLIGKPTNWGLKEVKEAKALAKQKQLYGQDFQSTYMGSYQNTSPEDMRFPRCALSKHLSTRLLPSNNFNNNLHLRGKPNLRIPEVLPAELTQVSV